MPFDLDFLDNLRVGAYRTTPDGWIQRANVALSAMLGYPEGLIEANARHLYVDVEDREKWRRDVDSNGGDVSMHETRFRRPNGQIVRVLEASRAIYENESIVAYEGIVLDISDRPAPLEAPIEADSRLAMQRRRTQQSIDAVLMMLPVCVSRKNRKREVFWANDTFCRLESVSRDELFTSKNTDALLYGDDMDAKYHESDEQVFRTGEPLTLEEPHRCGDKSVRNVTVIKVPLFAEDRITVEGVEVYYWDDETLAIPLKDIVRARRISQLFSSPGTAIFEHDLDGNYRYLSPAAAVLLGRDSVEGINMSEVIAPEYLDIARAQFEKKVRNPSYADDASIYELELLRSDGRRIPVEIVSRLMREASTATSVMGYIRDLTAEKRRLSEMHHRVKNNLHTIHALLDMEMRSVGLSSDATPILRDCRSRIMAIADIHKELYEANRADHIAVKEFVRKLASKLVRTYSQPWQEIDVRVTVDSDLFLSLDAMIPCTLVLQELMSNAMKHAFPKKDKDRKTRGTIMVTFGSADEPGVIQLQCADTGVGMSQAIDPDRLNSLGMKLVFGLVREQLGGTIRQPKSSRGTYFVIEFRDPSPVLR